MTKDDLARAAQQDAVVLMTVGATEQHGAHLPTGTDSRCAQAVARQAAERANGSELRAVVAPPVWVGYSRDHRGFPGTLTVRHRTLSLLLTDLAVSAVDSGFRRILFVNGHGSNDRLLYYVLRDVQDSAPGATALAAVTYWKMAPDVVAAERTSTAGGMAHACEFETSLMLSHHPDLVRMELAQDERAHEYSEHRRQELFGGGPVMAPDHFADLTRSGVVGDPTRADAEKGTSWSEAISTRLAELICDMRTWPLTPPRQDCAGHAAEGGRSQGDLRL